MLGFGDEIEEVIQQALVHPLDVEVRGLEGDRTGRGVGDPAVKLGQEGVEVAGDEVNDVMLGGLGGGEGGGIDDGLLKLVGVAAAFLGDAADEGGGVIGDLVGQGFGQFLS